MFHPWKATTTVVLGVILGLFSFYAYQVNTALGVVATEPFNPVEARQAILAAPAVEVTPTTIQLDYDEPAFDVNEDPLALIDESYGAEVDPAEIFPTAISEPIPDEIFDAYLLLGTDASGFLADSIILGLQPKAGGSPIMVSLPRDLWVWNMCRQAFSRLNEGLGGCKGVASGPELMAIMVEDYTGIPIDHLARINFQGFAGLVDVMGGISVCVDYPTRDERSHLDIPAGCQQLDGEQALAWVRSRSTEQLQGEEWVRVAGSDFVRQKRQQDVLFQLAGSAARVSSPGALTDALAHIAKTVRLDSNWTFGQAISTGWKYRGITRSEVRRFSIQTSGYRTARGAAVLLSDATFGEQLSSVWSG